MMRLPFIKILILITSNTGIVHNNKDNKVLLVIVVVCVIIIFLIMPIVVRDCENRAEPIRDEHKTKTATPARKSRHNTGAEGPRCYVPVRSAAALILRPPNQSTH